MTKLLHTPNTPRTHDASGRKVNEPVQCARCLTLWPCEPERLRLAAIRWEKLAGPVQGLPRETR